MDVEGRFRLRLPVDLGVFQAFAGYDPTGTAAPALFGRPPWAWFDVDCDHRVDMYDFYGLQTCFGAVTQPCLALFDYDASGTVDWPDAGQFGQTAGSPAMAAWQRRIVPSRYGNPFMWTGQRFDAATGQYHFWARTYSPHLGRWLQRDPLGYVDGVGLYEYVRSGPLNGTDPFGLYTPAEWVDWMQRVQDQIGLKNAYGLDDQELRKMLQKAIGVALSKFNVTQTQVMIQKLQLNIDALKNMAQLIKDHPWLSLIWGDSAAIEKLIEHLEQVQAALQVILDYLRLKDMSVDEAIDAIADLIDAMDKLNGLFGDNPIVGELLQFYQDAIRAIARAVDAAIDEAIDKNVVAIETGMKPCTFPQLPFGCDWADVCD